MTKLTTLNLSVSSRIAEARELEPSPLRGTGTTEWALAMMLRTMAPGGTLMAVAAGVAAGGHAVYHGATGIPPPPDELRTGTALLLGAAAYVSRFAANGAAAQLDKRAMAKHQMHRVKEATYERALRSIESDFKLPYGSIQRDTHGDPLEYLPRTMRVSMRLSTALFSALDFHSDR